MEISIIAALIASIAGILTSLIPFIRKLLFFRADAEWIKNAEVARLEAETLHIKALAEAKLAEAHLLSTKQRAKEMELATERLVEAIRALQKEGGTLSISLDEAVNTKPGEAKAK